MNAVPFLWSALTLLLVGCHSGTPLLTDLSPWATSPSHEGNKVVLFSSTRNLVGGWNHIPSDPHLQAVALGPRAPEYTPLEHEAVQSFGRRPYLPMVLVKKLGDWDQQHANGLEADWGGFPYNTFRALVVDFYLDSATVKIPTASLLKQRYGAWLDDANLARLDGQKAVLRLTITGPNEAWSGQFFLTLDPKTQANRWYRLTVAAQDFEYFTGDPWQPKPLDHATLADAVMGHLRIEPESQGNDRSRWGQVVRNFRPDLWSDGKKSPPETVKEIGIRFSALYALVD